MEGIAPTRSAVALRAGRLLAALGALPALGGCQDPSAIRPDDIRHSTVPRVAAPTAGSASRDATAAGPRLRYVVPEGWTDKGGGGLRLTTLSIGAEKEGHEVTVIPAAGTLESNVTRWQAQLEPNQDATAADTAVRAALAAAETVDVDGTQASVVMLGGGAATGASADASRVILAAMIPLDDTAALFVKYSGVEAVARRERERFVEFVRSIRWK